MDIEIFRYFSKIKCESSKFTQTEVFAVPFCPNTLLYFSSFRLAGGVEASNTVWQHDDNTTEGTTTLSTGAKGNFWFNILSFLLSWIFTQAFLTLLKRYIKKLVNACWVKNMDMELKLLQCVAIQSFISYKTVYAHHLPLCSCYFLNISFLILACF